MAVPPNPELGGCVIQLRLYLIDMVRKIIGGFRVIGPFTLTPCSDVYYPCSMVFDLCCTMASYLNPSSCSCLACSRAFYCNFSKVPVLEISFTLNCRFNGEL